VPTDKNFGFSYSREPLSAAEDSSTAEDGSLEAADELVAGLLVAFDALEAELFVVFGADEAHPAIMETNSNRERKMQAVLFIFNPPNLADKSVNTAPLLETLGLTGSAVDFFPHLYSDTDKRLLCGMHLQPWIIGLFKMA